MECGRLNDNLLAWSDGKVMFYTGVAWVNSQEITAAANEGGAIPFDFHVIPYPQGPSGDGTFTPRLLETGTSFLLVSKNQQRFCRFLKNT